MRQGKGQGDVLRIPVGQELVRGADGPRTFRMCRPFPVPFPVPVPGSHPKGV
jgi:hypothetical protein